MPQQRLNAAAFVKYDITEDLNLKLRAIYTSNEVPTELAPTPFFSSVTINTSNPTLTADQIALFQSTGLVAPNGDYQVFIGRRMNEVGPRSDTRDLDAVHLAAGLEGIWLGGRDWEIYGHFNQTDGTLIQTGNVSISAFQTALESGSCTIFGANQFSEACVDMVASTGSSTKNTEQTNLIATTSGDLFNAQLPSAETPIGFSIGIEYREEFADFKPDGVLNSDIAAFDPALAVEGRFSASEVFGEV